MGPMERLEIAREYRKVTIAELSTRLGRLGRGLSASVSTIHKYKRGKEPALAFFEGAAAVLAIRLPWLVTGEGEMTLEAEAEREETARLATRDAAAAQQRAVWEYANRQDAEREAWLDAADAALPKGTTLNELQRRALHRFNDKLVDTMRGLAPWTETTVRQDLINAAARFLVETEAAFMTATDLDSVSTNERLRLVKEGAVIRESASRGFNAMFYDATLDLFARRVNGLGERSNSFGDTHRPAAPEPLWDGPM